MKIAKLGLILGITFNLALPASALPGQRIGTVVKWSKNHPLLPLITKQVVHEQGVPEYGTPNTQFKDGEFNFNVWINSKAIVTSENVDYRSQRGGLAFTRDNSNGLKLIQQVYNQDVVNDFRNSKYVDKVGDDSFGNSQFYRGRRFAYQTWNSSNNGIYHFTVIPLNDLQATVGRWRYCEVHDCGP